jgi:GT2 family glycosyltransferase
LSEYLGSVVILNLNGIEYIEEALEAVLAQTVIDRLKVVVLDQASMDGSYELIRRRFGDRLELLRADRNIGYTAGNNLAFARTEGKYILRLDSDAAPEHNWAEELIRAAESDAGAGMCTSKILFYHDRSLIDCAGHNIFPDGLNRSRGNMERDVGQYDRREETLFASGCASLYLREKVLESGGFDEDFFIYGDDADLGLKLRLQGWKCLYVPTAVVYHHGSKAFGPDSLRKLFLIERNRVWVMLKYFPVSWILAGPWHTVRRLFTAWRASKKGAGISGSLARSHSSLRLAGTILHAWGAALWKLPRTLSKRRKLMAGKKISCAEFKRLLKWFRASLKDMSFGAANAKENRVSSDEPG